METVSIIVPIYNVEAYLARCLDSLLQQTYQNIEIIAINDGSTDNSLAILQEYASKHPSIKVIDQANQGLSQARNHGMWEATGECIMFVDSDDYLKEDSVEALVGALEFGIDMVEMPMYDVYDDKATWSNYQTPIAISDIDLKEHPKWLFEIAIYVCGRLYRSTLIQELRFPPQLHHEDNYFTTCLLPKLHKIRKITDGGYYYYHRKDSITTAYDTNMYDMIAIQKRIHATFQVLNLYSDYGWICEKMAVRNLCVAILGKKMAFLKKEYWHTRKAHYDEIKGWMKQQYPNWRDNPYVTSKERLYVSVLLMGYTNAWLLWKGVRNFGSNRL